MKNSRADILGRIRERLGRDVANRPPAEQRAGAWLAARRVGPVPRSADNPVDRFVAMSESMSSTVDRIPDNAGLPAAVARYLDAHRLPRRAVCWAGLSALDWAGAGLTIDTRGAADADLVGITGCFCAVAETGSLMLCGGPESPSTVSLLPETHIAAVSVERIVPTMEEAWALARAELGELPRAVNFISGPSRTGDIEQTIVLGAHGPYRVHVVLIG